MPTSKIEADNIKKIIDEYLTKDKAKEITKRLDEEIGQKTKNSSLRESLSMLRKLYETNLRLKKING